VKSPELGAKHKGFVGMKFTNGVQGQSPITGGAMPKLNCNIQFLLLKIRSLAPFVIMQLTQSSKKNKNSSNEMPAVQQRY